EVKENGYLKDGKIIDLLMSQLTDEDRVRLNRYTDKDMQFKIFLDGHKDITDKDRKQLLTEMQKITNYILEEKKTCKDGNCKYEIIRKKDEKGNFIKKGEKEYPTGNKLIGDLLEAKEEVSVTNHKDPNKWVVGSETSGAKGTKAKIDMTDIAVLLVWDSVNKRSVPEEEEKFIEYAHELIHIHRFIFGRFAWNNKTGEMDLGTHWAIDKNGIVREDIWIDDKGNKNIGKPTYGLIEEYGTIGIGNKSEKSAGTIGVTGEYNIKGDITENMIRKEHGIRYRAFYRTNEPKVKEKKKQDEIYNNFLKKMERK
ncbi:hypothetical protein, partial [Leptotrichia sp. OH3620_COT-345]|uniref:hypothetical protein n=1 Tax=Leptotrichia sp. OH3620_COT-345 TaxID=2491048 RepID=UPI00131595CE